MWALAGEQGGRVCPQPRRAEARPGSQGLRRQLVSPITGLQSPSFCSSSPSFLCFWVFSHHLLWEPGSARSRQVLCS